MDEVRRARILEVLRPDDPLPSVRQLAVELRVNPNTVGQAYRELEREGLVYVRRGQGTFATAVLPPSEAPNERARAVAEKALLDAHRSGVDVDDLIEALRAVAERKSLNLAEHP